MTSTTRISCSPRLNHSASSVRLVDNRIGVLSHMSRKLVYYNDVPVGNICCRLENKELYLTTLGILAVRHHLDLYRSDGMTFASQSLIDAGNWALKPCSASLRPHLSITNPKSSAYLSTYRSPMRMPRGSTKATGLAKLASTKITTKRLPPEMHGYWRKSSKAVQNNSYTTYCITRADESAVCVRPRIWKSCMFIIYSTYAGVNTILVPPRGLGVQDEINI